MLLLVLLTNVFATTTNYPLPSNLRIILQPYLTENSTHVLALTSTMKYVSETTFTFIARCYKHCSSQSYYYKLIYNNNLCNFNIHLITGTEYGQTSGNTLTVSNFLEIVRSNYNSCNQKPTSTYEEFLEYIKQKRYSVINNYYFMVELYKSGSPVSSNKVYILKHYNNNYPKYISDEKFQMLYNNHLYTVLLNNQYPSDSNYKVLSIRYPINNPQNNPTQNGMEDSSSSSPEIIPDRKIHLLFKTCETSDYSIIDEILPNDQSYYGIYNNRYAIRPKVLQYYNGIHTNKLWYYINENNKFEVVNVYTSVTNQGNFNQQPTKFDELISILNTNMNCQFVSNNQCRNGLCTKNSTGYYVKLDITENFMVGLTGNYRIKVT